jgi:hypothetical protein
MRLKHIICGFLAASLPSHPLWVYFAASLIQDEQGDTSDMMWLGSLPFSKPKAALSLLEHGFLPYELHRIWHDLCEVSSRKT